MSKFALLFLLIFFGGIFAALFFSSAAAFWLYQLVYLLNPDDRWWAAAIPGLPYSFVASALMLFVMMLNYRSLTSVSPWSRHPSFKWIVILLLLYVVALGYALAPNTHRIFLVNFIKLIVIFFVAYKLINDEKKLDISLWVYCIGSTYVSYLIWGTGRNASGRVEGIGFADGTDGNGVAAVLAPPLVLLLYYFWQGSKKLKLLSVFCGALIANALVLINSRGAFLAVALSAGIFTCFMIFSKWQQKGQRAAAVFVIVVSAAGALYVTDDLFWERMGTLKSFEEDEGRTSGAYRMQFWWATFDMVGDNPFGMGISGYNVLSRTYIPPEFMGDMTSRSVHSSWFQLLSDVGWPGVVVFFFLFVSLASTSRKAKKYVLSQENHNHYFKILAIECGLISYFIAATFIDRIRAEAFWWAILFVMISSNVFYLKFQEARGDMLRTKGRVIGGGSSG
ncbi:O-antigen ligase family protein [Marinobacter sp. M1N3S26]|uniref:O-antigen ligase family protein n=1 Tax=Marinobacter sp. M1N3S26 TaxID=3382299 RepID=UPI00387B4712